MTTEKEFNYTATSQKKYLKALACLVSALSSFFFADVLTKQNYYMPYEFHYPLMLVLSTGGLLAGGLLGHFLYKNFLLWKHILRSAAFFCTLILIIYILKDIIFKTENSAFFSALIDNSNIVPWGLFLFFTCSGIIWTYVLRTSCGTFIDETRPLSEVIIYIPAGILLGIATTYIQFASFAQTAIPYLYTGITVIAFIMLFISTKIRLDVNPAPLIAQHFKEDSPIPTEKIQNRNDLFFNYFNCALIVFFSHLCYLTAISSFGNITQVHLLFIQALSGGILAGYLLGSFLKKAFWHIYSEMLFPLAAISCIIALKNFETILNIYTGAIIITIASAIFGISLRATVQNTLSKDTQDQRYTVFIIAFIILPFPLLMALHYMDLSHSWFFSLLYGVSFITILLPGLHLNTSSVSRVKKLAYFAVTLIFIPGIILIHMYFNLPFDQSLYANNIKGFEALKNINYNAPFIKTNSTVYMNGTRIFHVSDSTIKNLERALLPLFLYSVPDKKTCFIDTNQRFYKNPIIGLFKNATCIDPIPFRKIDNMRLPLAESRGYVTIEEEFISFLSLNKGQYQLLVDIPNLMDQHRHAFRYSKEFYSLCASSISQEGVFAQIFQLQDIDPAAVSRGLQNIKSVFSELSVYLFSDTMTIVASQNPMSLTLDRSRINQLEKILESNKNLKNLVVNEEHVLSHFITSNLDTIRPYVPDKYFPPNYMIGEIETYQADKEFISNYLKRNTGIKEVLSNKPSDRYHSQALVSSMSQNERIHYFLKEAELANSEGNFLEETNYLFELKRYTPYHTQLRLYLKNHLSIKEEFYQTAAEELEKEKKWEDARKLYHAILNINPNNFNATYRMGLLSIVLQNLDDAFTYLQKALRLNRDDPRVLYEMGVLLLSNNRPEEAISFLNQALKKRYANAGVYLYLGLAHEDMGQLKEAESYYTKALIQDPNDANIQQRLDNIKEQQKSDRSKWIQPQRKNNVEEEQGETIPIPINRSAYDIRINDEEAQKK